MPPDAHGTANSPLRLAQFGRSFWPCFMTFFFSLPPDAAAPWILSTTKQTGPTLPINEFYWPVGSASAAPGRPNTQRTSAHWLEPMASLSTRSPSNTANPPPFCEQNPFTTRELLRQQLTRTRKWFIKHQRVRKSTEIVFVTGLTIRSTASPHISLYGMPYNPFPDGHYIHPFHDQSRDYSSSEGKEHPRTVIIPFVPCRPSCPDDTCVR